MATNSSEYQQGYNDAIELIKQMLNGGGGGGSDPMSGPQPDPRLKQPNIKNTDQDGQGSNGNGNNKKHPGGNGTPSGPSGDDAPVKDNIDDLKDKSRRYKDAYRDELEKQMNKVMNGQNPDKPSNNTDNGQNGDGQTGNQPNGDGQTGNQPGGDSNNQGSSGNSQNGDGQSDGQSGNSQNGNGQSGEQPNGDGRVNGQSGKESDNIEQQARNKAREDIKKMLDDLKNKEKGDPSGKRYIDSPSDPTKGENNRYANHKNAPDMPVKMSATTSSLFGGADMVSKETMADLAREAGDPYTSNELATDPIKESKRYVEDHKDDLKSVDPDLANKLDDIANKLKSTPSMPNWREQLKRHFREAVKGNTVYTRSKRTMSQRNRTDRYMPYKEVAQVENLGVNIFYLIDNSASMYWAGGNDIFYRIFKDIFTIEKSCKVQSSALAYFTTGRINPKNVRMWDDKTSISRRIQLMEDRGNSGGTDIPGNVISVTKLKKPYYYNTGSHHTMILVFTDGEDYGGWGDLKSIPASIRRDLVFVIINNMSGIKDAIPHILSGGIKMTNIIGINTAEFKDKK